MKAKNLAILLITIFFISSSIFGKALAGDENNPEVEDETGETTEPQRGFRDIDKAWFGETNDTLLIYMKLASSPPSLYEFAQNIDTTAFDYEV
jgi:hypothetical protein